MEGDEALIAELQRRATGANIHWAVGTEHAYRGLVKLSRTASTEERRAEAEREAARVEQDIREALTRWSEEESGTPSGMGVL